MTPSIISTNVGTTGGNSSTVAITYPTAGSVGDLLLAVVGADGDVTQTNLPSGWMAAADNRVSSLADTLIFLKRKATGSEFGGTFTFNISGSEQQAWQMLQIRGWGGTVGTDWSGTLPGDAQAATDAGSGSNPALTALDPLSGDTTHEFLWLAAAAVDTARTISGFPLGDSASNQWSTTSTGSGGVTLGICADTVPGTYTNGTVSASSNWTFSASDDYSIATFGIAPAAGAAGGDVTVTGVRAQVRALGRAGTVRLDSAAVGVRAQVRALGRAGSVNIGISATVTGVRGQVRALGRVGTFRLDQAVAGSRAQIRALGRAGAVRLDSAATGTRAQTRALGRPGGVATATTGVRAAVYTIGRAGTPTVRFTGTRAVTYTNGRAGTVQITTSSADVTVVGVRAAARALGRAGTVRLDQATIGTRAQTRALGRAGTVQIVTGQVDATIVGVRATSYAETVSHDVRVMDNFDRSDRSLENDGPWRNTDPTGASHLQIVSNQVGRSASGSAKGYWSGLTYTNPEIQISLPVMPEVSGSVWIQARLQEPGGTVPPDNIDPSWDGYEFGLTVQADGVTGQFVFDTVLNGNSSIIATTAGGPAFPISAGDKIKFKVVGNRLEGWFKHDGEWALVLTIDDTTYPNPGESGFECLSASVRADDYGAREAIAMGGPRITVTGVRASAGAIGRAGTTKTTVTGTRPVVYAVARAGTAQISGTVTVQGVRAAVYTGARTGTLRLDQAVAGARAQTRTLGRAGSALISIHQTITGTRAQIRALGRAGTLRLDQKPLGTRAVVYAVARAGAAVTGGNITVQGVRAQVRALGRAGTLRLDQAVAGARAAIYANGRAGSTLTTIHQTVAGVRAVVYTVARAGTLRLDQAVAGTRAQSRALGRAGSVSTSGNITVTGVRAVVYTGARAGDARLDQAIIGTRAQARALGRAGSTSTVTGTVIVGVRATVYAVARVGTLRTTSTLTGTRAAIYISGRAGSPAIIVGGTRAVTRLASRAGGTSNALTGVRAAATATGRAGQLSYPAIIIGTRARVYVRTNAGTGSEVAGTVLTWHTLTSTDDTRTVVVTDRRRTIAPVNNGQTRVTRVY